MHIFEVKVTHYNTNRFDVQSRVMCGMVTCAAPTLLVAEHSSPPKEAPAPAPGAAGLLSA